MRYLSRKVLPFAFVAALTCAFSPFSSSAFDAERKENSPLRVLSSPSKGNVSSRLKEMGVDVSPENLAHGMLLNRLQYPLSENSLKAASALKQKGQEITSDSLNGYLVDQIQVVFGRESIVECEEQIVRSLNHFDENLDMPFYGYVGNANGELVSFSDLDALAIRS